MKLQNIRERKKTLLYSEHKKQKPAFLQLKWTYTTTSPKQSIPWPPNIRGFKVDNIYSKRSEKGQFDLGLSQKKPQILSTGM